MRLMAQQHRILDEFEDKQDIWEIFMIFFVWYIGASLWKLGEATIPSIPQIAMERCFFTKPEDVGYNYTTH